MPKRAETGSAASTANRAVLRNGRYELDHTPNELISAASPPPAASRPQRRWDPPSSYAVPLPPDLRRTQQWVAPRWRGAQTYRQDVTEMFAMPVTPGQGPRDHHRPDCVVNSVRDWQFRLGSDLNS
jgi:hypothetical protein